MNTRQRTAALAAITAIDTDTPIDPSLTVIRLFDGEQTSGITINYEINRKREAQEYMNGFDWTGEPDPEMLPDSGQRAKFYRWEAEHERAADFLHETWNRLRKAVKASAA
jgi:hypothetical protein